MLDAITIEAARRGERQAQTILLRDLQDPWFRLCHSLLGNAEMARDATQETALRFLRQIHSFRGASQLKTWSFGIAINVAREMQRNAMKPMTIDPRNLAAAQRAGLSPVESAVTTEQQSKLHDLLAHLPDRQREALLLRFFEDLSVEQTAAAMGCAAGTVKATVHQALRALRSKLEQTA